MPPPAIWAGEHGGGGAGGVAEDVDDPRRRAARPAGADVTVGGGVPAVRVPRRLARRRRGLRGRCMGQRVARGFSWGKVGRKLGQFRRRADRKFCPSISAPGRPNVAAAAGAQGRVVQEAGGRGQSRGKTGREKVGKWSWAG
jgi:hypothetical protein